MRKVLVMIPVDAEDRANLERGISDCQFVYAKGEPTAEEILSANVIIGTPPLSILKDCKNLELLQLNTSGVGGYIEEGVLPETTVLTNATGAYGLAISEYMVGVAFMMVKKLHLYRDNQAKHQWNDEGDVKAIEDCTTLTVGLGSIGGNFARRMKAMGSAVIGVRRVAGAKPPYLDRVCTTEELDEVLPLADIVGVSLPETPRTVRLFNRERIARMKKGAILINVGRGSVLDTEALCDALLSGQLGGAVLDVTDPEPLPPGHRLWDIPSALITPHISGGYHIPQIKKYIVDVSAKNIRALLSGGAFENLVDFETGYKMSER